jgi:hypothetical protein
MGGMTRRRLVTIIAVGLAAVVAVWAHAVWRQYRIEQQLVGAWRRVNPPNGIGLIMYLMADGRTEVKLELELPIYTLGEYWSVWGDLMTLDSEAEGLHRLLRPLAALVGRDRAWRQTYRHEVTADRLELVDPNGRHVVYIRESPR